MLVNGKPITDRNRLRLPQSIRKMAMAFRHSQNPNSRASPPVPLILTPRITITLALTRQGDSSFLWDVYWRETNRVPPLPAHPREKPSQSGQSPAAKNPPQTSLAGGRSRC